MLSHDCKCHYSFNSSINVHIIISLEKYSKPFLHIMQSVWTTSSRIALLLLDFSTENHEICK